MDLTGETEHLEVKEFIKCVWLPTEDQYYISILEEEKHRAGISSYDISLSIPEQLPYHDPELLGFSDGSRDEGYAIGINPSGGILFDFRPRKTIRHEIAHIKYGDCDINPEILKKLHYWFIGEPRARWYARKA